MRLSRQQAPLKFYSNKLFERDVRVTHREGVKIVTHVEYGALPMSLQVNKNVFNQVRRVPGAFLNLTSLGVPSYVESFLSLGPKFMLPPYSLLSEEDKKEQWRGALDKLEKMDYFMHGADPDYHRLSGFFREHVGDVNYVRKIDRMMLDLASEVATFLERHRRSCMLVDGDKGKVVVLMYRKDFAALSDAFISGGLASGKSY